MGAAGQMRRFGGNGIRTLLSATRLKTVRMGATILQDLVVVMVIAAAVTILFYKLRQPVVLGYLLAGLVIGPGALGLIHDVVSIHGLADLGIIFLMFAVGLEFDLKKLRKVGIPAAIVAAAEVGAMLAIGYYVGKWLGWSDMDSIFLGAVISISSTTIIVKILTEMGKLKEDYTELAFGILIIEDLLGIILVALLSSFGVSGAVDTSIIPAVVGAVILFVFIFIAVGLVLVPRLIESVSKFHVEEVLVITVVGLAFAAALLAQNLGFSLALGAFLIGAIIAESKAVQSVEHKIVPIRDMFTAMFFVAIGMLIDPRHIVEYWPVILLVAVATIVGKVVSVSLTSFLVGNDGRTAMKTATALGQIGEFSFIIAGLGLSMGVVREELPPVAIAVCALTSLATPVLMKYGNKTTDWIAPRLPRWYVRVLDAYLRLVRKLTAKRERAHTAHELRRSRHGARIGIYAAWLFGLLLVAAYASRWLGTEVSDRLSLGDNATRAATLGFLGLTGLPLFVAFSKATEAYTFSRAKEREMDPRHLIRADKPHRRPKTIARAVSVIASIVLVAVAVRVAWGVHPLALPSTWLLVPVLGLIGGLGFLLRHRLERVYHGMERTLNELMDVDDEPHEDVRNRFLRERLPFGLDAEEVTVRNFTRAAYGSLKTLDLRGKTGATVLAVERRAGVIHNPHADILLLPNDRIVLVGTPTQLEKARRYMEEGVPEMREANIVSSGIRVPASSPAVGHRIGELDFDSTGARLGVVVKKDGSLYAPSERVTLEPDDQIVVYGPEASIAATRERLKVKPFPDPRPRRGPAGR